MQWYHCQHSIYIVFKDFWKTQPASLSPPVFWSRLSKIINKRTEETEFNPRGKNYYDDSISIETFRMYFLTSSCHINFQLFGGHVPIVVIKGFLLKKIKNILTWSERFTFPVRRFIFLWFLQINFNYFQFMDDDLTCFVSCHAHSPELQPGLVAKWMLHKYSVMCLKLTAAPPH